MAFLRPMVRAMETAGVWQKSPMLTPGVAKRERVEATARSHAACVGRERAGREG